jgi:hypothetical protein
MSIPVAYKTKKLNVDLRLDVLVEDLVLCELKAVETLLCLSGEMHFLPL